MLTRLFSYAKMVPTALKLNTMYLYGTNHKKDKIIELGKFMHGEVPVRLARCINYLDEFPFSFLNIKQIENVRNLYLSSFNSILNTKNPENTVDCYNLANILTEMKDNHSTVQENLGYGIQQYIINYPKFNYNSFLDKFYISRIGIRTIMEQYINLVNKNEGIIKMCNPYQIISAMINDVQYISENIYGECPNINIYGDKIYSFPYIPSHLYYIIFELLKNSLRATMEYNIKNNIENSINVYISKGKNDVIIKISDLGGGFSRNDIKKVFNYSFTTVKTNIDDQNIMDQRAFMLAGYGYGLPLSRLYVNYFQGKLIIIPYNGIGTDAIVYINKMGDKTEIF